MRGNYFRAGDDKHLSAGWRTLEARMLFRKDGASVCPAVDTIHHHYFHKKTQPYYRLRYLFAGAKSSPVNMSFCIVSCKQRKASALLFV